MNNNERGYKLNTIGLDKMKLKRLFLNISDISKLYNRGNVTINESSLYKREFVTPNGSVNIGELIIDDELFHLKVGVKRVNVNKFIPYEYLEINPATIIHGSNISNINKKSDLLEALTIVENRLRDYGVAVKLENSTIDEVEININIQLEEDFNSYKNAFEVIKKCLPKTYKRSGSYEDRDLARYTGFKVENKEISLKFYDKLIEKGMIVDYSILRIEYRLLKESKVNSKFEFVTICELLNQFDSIEIVFKELINKDITTKVSKYVKSLVKTNYESMKVVKEKEYHYLRCFLATSQDMQIFDFAIIAAAIDKLDIDKSNKSRGKREIVKLLKKRELVGDNLFFNNIKKLNEILSGLGENNIIIK